MCTCDKPANDVSVMCKCDKPVNLVVWCAHDKSVSVVYVMCTYAKPANIVSVMCKSDNQEIWYV